MAQAANQASSVTQATYKDRLRWHLQRADDWVKIADSKATILFSLNGAIMMAMVALKRDDIKSFITSSWFLTALSLLFAAAILFSVFFSTKAILPELRKKPTFEKSIFNPAVVGKMDLQGFRNMYRSLDEPDELKHIENQVHALSQIATRKFEQIQKSIFCLALGMLLGALLVAASVAN